jgi:uridine kinase
LKTVFNSAVQIKSVLKNMHLKKESTKALVVALSGIEGSGKRELAQSIAGFLELDGIRVAVIRDADWEAPKDVRFNVMSSPEEYYFNAYRYDHMFEDLILPLKLFSTLKKSITLDDVMSPRTIEYDFTDIDIIIIEGVYLLQDAYLQFYDYTCWMQSDFDTAFYNLTKRINVEESQESLVNIFELLIKPAAQYHIFIDDPQGAAKSVYLDDNGEFYGPDIHEKVVPIESVEKVVETTVIEETTSGITTTTTTTTTTTKVESVADVIVNKKNAVHKQKEKINELPSKV